MSAQSILSRSTKSASGCWEWTGYLDRDGYAKACGKMAYRVVYEEMVGPIASGMHVDHLCRNRKCVNPAHLEVVTPAENNRRKEQALGIGAYATHCPKGHEYNDENTYRWRRNRICRPCNTAATVRYQKSKKICAAT